MTQREEPASIVPAAEGVAQTYPVAEVGGPEERQLPLMSEDEAREQILAIVVRDGLDQPIPQIDVQVELPDGTRHGVTTDGQGHALIPRPKSTKGEARVWVKGADRTPQEVCRFDLARCGSAVKITSPKVAAPIQLRQNDIHVGTTTQTGSGGSWYDPALDKAWSWLKAIVNPRDQVAPASGANGTAPHVAKITSNKAGNPIVVLVGPECPNSDNLRLGRNNIYRQAIQKAAKRIGLIPQAIAALIDAEAAKREEYIPVLNPDGTPKIHAKGPMKGQRVHMPIREQWNADSANGSGAVGLTQFLPSTWLAHAMKQDCFLHEQCRREGWIKQGRDGKGRGMLVFVLENGAVTAEPWRHQRDSLVRRCLDKRRDPEWSIMAAADYGKANLKLLEVKGFKLTGLNDAEKAKLMYLMHHEGEGNGPLFIRNRLCDMPKKQFHSSLERLDYIFSQQVGQDEAVTRKARAGGDIQAAYRSWLAEYINSKIRLDVFCCDHTSAVIGAELSEIFIKIGGAAV